MRFNEPAAQETAKLVTSEVGHVIDYGTFIAGQEKYYLYFSMYVQFQLLSLCEIFSSPAERPL